MRRSQQDLLVQDLQHLGREYLYLVRQIARENMPLAVELFCARRPQLLHRLCRMSSVQIELLLDHGGLPFSFSDEARLHADLLDLPKATPRVALDEPTTVRCEWLQMAFLERVRQIAHVDMAEAGSLFHLHGFARSLSRLAKLGLAELRMLSRLHHALAINSSVAYELLVSMIATDASEERVVIAGIAAVSSGRSSDISLRGESMNHEFSILSAEAAV